MGRLHESPTVLEDLLVTDAIIVGFRKSDPAESGIYRDSREGASESPSQVSESEANSESQGLLEYSIDAINDGLAIIVAPCGLSQRIE